MFEKTKGRIKTYNQDNCDESKKEDNGVICKGIILFIVLVFIEFILLTCITKKFGGNYIEFIINNMVQLLLFNLACITLINWYKDNKLANKDYYVNKYTLFRGLEQDFNKSISIINENIQEIQLSLLEYKNDELDEKIDKFELLDKLNTINKNQKDLKNILKKLDFYGSVLDLKKYFFRTIEFEACLEILDKLINTFNGVLIDFLLNINIDKDKNLINLLNQIKEIIIYNHNEIIKIYNCSKELENHNKYIELPNKNLKIFCEIYSDIYKYLEEIKSGDLPKNSNIEYLSNGLKAEEYKQKIGRKVSNYFKPIDINKIMICTSSNWSKNADSYSTWYSFFKETKGRNYYFVIRDFINQFDSSDEIKGNEGVKYLKAIFIDNENMEKLLKGRIKDSRERVHLYLCWNKNEEGKLIDEREKSPYLRNIYENIDYKIIDLQMKNGMLYDVENRVS